MKLPVGWLREYVDFTVEVGRLADDLTLAGLAVDGIEGKGDEAVLELDITTNRVDAMNVYGLAREVAVLYGSALRPLPIDVREEGPPASVAWSIDIEAPELCPRFCGRVLDVKIGPSPSWMRDRLEQVGVRPINNLVDLTNYVMMEMGQPTHAFDLAKVPEGRLVVRWSRAGEKIVTLDGQERTLAGKVGVIGGTRGALGLAGIMGGASSEVSESTRTVALEAAYWDPPSIRRAAKALGMHTEASHRFERGADPEAPPAALARIAHLLAKIHAGSARPGLIDRYVAPRPRTRVGLRPARITSVLGTPVAVSESRRILTGLGFAVGRAERGLDGRRPHLARRRHARGRPRRGDRTPSRPQSRALDHPAQRPRGGPAPGPETRPGAAQGAGRRRADGGGHVFVRLRRRDVHDRAVPSREPAQRGAGRPARLARVSGAAPGAADQCPAGPARPGRVRAGPRLRVGSRGPPPGRPRGAAPRHPPRRRRARPLVGGRAAAATSSTRRASSSCWPGISASPRRGSSPCTRCGTAYCTPGSPRCCEPVQPGRPVEYLGVLHPDLVAKWELKEAPIVAEIDPARFDVGAPVRARALARFPAVERDLSVLCDASVPSAEVLAEIRRAGGPLLREVRVVDKYDRPPVPAGRVSLTVALAYQDPARTLTGEEVQSSVDAVVSALRARGWDIRGE